MSDAPPPSLEDLWNALRRVVDPELGLNLVALGLVYALDVSPEGAVRVALTMTTPACPQADLLVEEVFVRLRRVPGVTHAEVELVWSPPWTPERMSDEAKAFLGWGA